MSYENHLKQARIALKAARDAITTELQDYPSPVSGCDAQYNHLIGQRSAIGSAIAALDCPPFVATPRTPDPGAGVESR